MKKQVVFWFFSLWILLSGCSAVDGGMGQAMDFRARLTSSNGCSFDTQITADYGDQVYTFSMNCKADNDGNLAFTVTAPQTLEGITGMIDAQGGKLTFDDTALAFELLADGRLSPVSAPWVLVHTLHYGYITSCARTDNGPVISINDSYKDDALNLSVYLDQNSTPVAAEIFWKGSRVLSLTVNNFAFQ